MKTTIIFNSIVFSVLFSLNCNSQQNKATLNKYLSDWNSSILLAIENNNDVYQEVNIYKHLIEHPEDDELKLYFLEFLLSKYELSKNAFTIIECTSLHDTYFYLLSKPKNEYLLSKYVFEKNQWKLQEESYINNVNLNFLYASCNEKYNELLSQMIITTIKDCKFNSHYSSKICEGAIKKLEDLL